MSTPHLCMLQFCSWPGVAEFRFGVHHGQHSTNITDCTQSLGLLTGRLGISPLARRAIAISRLPPGVEAPGRVLAAAALLVLVLLLPRRREACFRSCMMPRPLRSGPPGSPVSAAMLLLSSLKAPPA